MIKPGDIVELKSGGPKMTVGKFKWFGKFVQCYWWQSDKSTYMAGDTVIKEYENEYYREREFPTAALKLSV